MNTTGERQRHILLVDDDPLVIKVYAERMRFEGWTVAVARDGWEACQEAKRRRFDLILLDIRMPFQDGVQVLSEIRQGDRNADTPVYILTGLKESEEVEDALRQGADGVLYKASTRPDELVKQAKAIFRKGRRPVAMPVPALAGEEPSTGPVDLTADSGPVADLSPSPPEGFAPGPEAAEGTETSAAEPVTGPLSPEPESVPPSLNRDFYVHVNPFLGDGAELSRALGLEDPYQCPLCGGQIVLCLAPDILSEARELRATFLCKQCKEQV